jgi:hypothetical protein
VKLLSYNQTVLTIRLKENIIMPVNPKSLLNLRPGANCKNAIRVNLTLAPQTVALLKAQGNMSQAVDKLIRLCILGAVQHDGCLNPIKPKSIMDN